MTDNSKPQQMAQDGHRPQKGQEIAPEGYQPLQKGWKPGPRNGYQPETSEAGPPPTGGSGAKEPEKK